MLHLNPPSLCIIGQLQIAYGLCVGAAYSVGWVGRIHASIAAPLGHCRTPHSSPAARSSTLPTQSLAYSLIHSPTRSRKRGRQAGRHREAKALSRLSGCIVRSSPYLPLIVTGYLGLGPVGEEAAGSHGAATVVGICGRRALAGWGWSSP